MLMFSGSVHEDYLGLCFSFSFNLVFQFRVKKILISVERKDLFLSDVIFNMYYTTVNPIQSSRRLQVYSGHEVGD